MRNDRIVIRREPSKLARINSTSAHYLQKYKVDMSLRNLALGTICRYEESLQQWFIFILDYQNNKDVRTITDDDITEFLFYCKSHGNNSERIKFYIASISAFYRYLRKKRVITENPVEFVDRPKRGMRITTQTYLTPEQVAVMREKLIANKDVQLRLYATLSLSTMARVSAIASLRWEQVDLDNKVIHNVKEKENKIVDLYFSDEVKCLLLQLREQRAAKNRDDHGWVLYTGRNKNKPIAVSTLDTWCKKIGKMIGTPTLHHHDFRHSGATLLKNAGMPLEDVSVLLNHESTETTKKFYIKQDTKRISNLKALYNI